MPFINPLNPEPLDPAYVKFRDGFAAWIIDKQEHKRLRWSPWSNGGEWNGFKPQEWEFLDSGAAQSPSTLLQSHTDFFSSPQKTTWQWQQFKSEGDIPSLWAELNKVYARLKVSHLRASWSPYDGSWREMRRKKVSTGDGDGPGDSPDPNYPTEF